MCLYSLHLVDIVVTGKSLSLRLDFIRTQYLSIFIPFLFYYRFSSIGSIGLVIELLSSPKNVQFDYTNRKLNGTIGVRLSSIDFSVEGTVKSSLKLSKSFQIFLPNQKLARALTSIPKAIAPANTSCCLATSGRNPRAQCRLGGGISTSTSTYSPDCYIKVVGHGLLWSPIVSMLDSIMWV